MWEEALRVKADMLEAGVTPNVVTWTSIIGACANAGLVEQSFREFDEMLSAGCRPNVNCYNMLLQACVMVTLLACYVLSSTLPTFDETAQLRSTLHGKEYIEFRQYSHRHCWECAGKPSSKSVSAVSRMEANRPNTLVL